MKIGISGTRNPGFLKSGIMKFPVPNPRYYAGGVNQTGNNTISIGYAMNASSTTESNSCRISNIRGVTTIDNDAVAVLVSSTGQLGTVSSTRDKKENILLLDDTTEKIKQLKPSSFNFKCHCWADCKNGCVCPEGEECCNFCKCSESTTVGLIYDEVIDIIPEICVKDIEGNPATIQYHLIPIYLLRSLQEQIKKVETLENQLTNVINRLNILENK